ncbi:MAG: hypothetical protein K2X50_02105 [Gammaproteobacteria bacterium]|nr:hypothetical protein [Gammaproteobacteria bacterium]
MSLLTMTPCYSIMLCFLAVVLMVIIVAPLAYIILRMLWSTIASQLRKQSTVKHNNK